jgi:hypothetical protein
MAAGFKVQEAPSAGAPFRDVGFAAQEHWAHTADKAGAVAQANEWAGFEQYRLVPVDAPFELSDTEVACNVKMNAVELAAKIGLVSADGQKFTAPNSAGPALAGAAARYRLGAPVDFLGLDMLGLAVYGKAVSA